MHACASSTHSSILKLDLPLNFGYRRSRGTKTNHSGAMTPDGWGVTGGTMEVPGKAASGPGNPTGACAFCIRALSALNWANKSLNSCNSASIFIIYPFFLLKRKHLPQEGGNPQVEQLWHNALLPCFQKNTNPEYTRYKNKKKQCLWHKIMVTLPTTPQCGGIMKAQGIFALSTMENEPDTSLTPTTPLWEFHPNN